MAKYALLVELKAKPGLEAEVEKFRLYAVLSGNGRPAR